MTAPLTDAERNANYEHMRQALVRLHKKPTDAEASRSAILNAMGAWSDGLLAKPEIMELLDQHEVNLRRAWEHAELQHARQRAEDVVRGAVRAAMEGKLL